MKKHFKKMLPMSKMEEREVWLAFINALPEQSYLHGQLCGLLPILSRAMDDDVCFNIAEILNARGNEIGGLKMDAFVLRENLKSCRELVEIKKIKIESLEISIKDLDEDRYRAESSLDQRLKEIESLKSEIYGLQHDANPDLMDDLAALLDKYGLKRS